VYCSQNQIKSLSQADFGKVMKQVYPKVRARRLGTRGNSRYCYSGLRRCIKLKPPKLPDLADKPLVSGFYLSIKNKVLIMIPSTFKLSLMLSLKSHCLCLHIYLFTFIYYRALRPLVLSPL
jgi:hypothetical protein